MPLFKNTKVTIVQKARYDMPKSFVDLTFFWMDNSEGRTNFYCIRLEFQKFHLLLAR